jgi:hypothetical protein
VKPNVNLFPSSFDAYTVTNAAKMNEPALSAVCLKVSPSLRTAVGRSHTKLSPSFRSTKCQYYEKFSSLTLIMWLNRYVHFMSDLSGAGGRVGGVGVGSHKFVTLPGPILNTYRARLERNNGKLHLDPGCFAISMG